MLARETGKISKHKFVEVREGAKSIFDRVLLPELESLVEAVPVAEENLTGGTIRDFFAKRRIGKMRKQRNMLMAIKWALNYGSHPGAFDTAFSHIEILLFDARSFESNNPDEEVVSHDVAQLRDNIKFMTTC